MNPWLCMPPENSVDWGKWDMLTGAAPVMKAAPQGTLRVPAFWPRGALDRVGLLYVGASSGFSGFKGWGRNLSSSASRREARGRFNALCLCNETSGYRSGPGVLTVSNNRTKP
ncbi:MAG: hypothetical protein ING37_10625 [Rhodocyclaceae bacterium]|nr:hypothetical protein [Rhodocyclaceae bacterium]